jgi:DNA polymerase III epsilon subunit family exonuclease
MRLLDAGRMRYAVIDLETTGFSAMHDRVVEMACVLIQDRAIVEHWSTLVNPERPIPEYATRVHGITDADVAFAPSFELAQRRLYRFCRGATVVAHNAAFDLSFLPALHRLPSLCTVRLARRAFPHAPNYKNQTLRAYLELDRDPALAAFPAHRALGDAMVTANILLRCLKTIAA